MAVTPAPRAGLINYDRMRETSDAFIQRNGRPAALRRPGAPDRHCFVVLIDWTAQEIMGRMYDPLSRNAITSADGLDANPPVMDLDRLVVFQRQTDTSLPLVVDEILRIVHPPVPLRPGDVTLQWSIAVRK